MEKAYTRLDMIRHLHADLGQNEALQNETPQAVQVTESAAKDHQPDG
jgi:hypothetical protein